MIGTRIEILTDKGWEKLRLRDGSSIKYNKLINKIGDLSNRQIGHTQTFELPKTHSNISILGINVFNRSELAKALNKKYEAKYFVEGRVLQEGFLIINNTRDNFIKVNFIDSSLDIIDQWGTTTLYGLLNSGSATIPSDYAAAISEMQSFTIDQNTIVTPLSEVGSRGFNLALYPNSLNTIGESFNLNTQGDRVDDRFNPYQSRPIFSAKAFFDLACYVYGYTPEYDDSVNWDDVEENYIVRSSMDEEPEDPNAESSEELNVTIPFFDEFLQYADEVVDLTRLAPNKTVRELLVGLMAKDGILMDINTKTNVIKFFSYSIYATQSELGNYSDWSNYLLKHSPFNYNTDYGNNFAKENVMGLANSYSGNEYILTLNNQGSDSKLKDSIEAKSKIFNDISAIHKINNTTTSYKEFSTEELSLVKHYGTLGNLEQMRVDFLSMGTISNVPLITNVSFTELPSGIFDWYNAVDESIKAEPSLLLPIDVVKNIDLSQPIYINEMMGFWIIEEIAEYENSQTPVVAKLIRMVDSAEYSGDYNNDFNT